MCTLYKKVYPLLPPDFTSKAFWLLALSLTYSSELRTESAGRSEIIYSQEEVFYNEVTSICKQELVQPNSRSAIQWLCKVSWMVRSVFGKFLSVVRLLKATLTFTNGIDYIAWKIERHTGESVIVSKRLRKYPWIFLLALAVSFN